MTKEINMIENMELTARELQVAARLASGFSNAETAVALNISTKTVDTHRMHIMEKSGMRNNAEFVRCWIEAGGEVVVNALYDEALVKLRGHLAARVAK